MNKSLVNRSISQVITQNKGISLLLLITITGVVIVSLIPPQILKLIIDNHLVPKNSTGMLRLAVIYMSVLVFIGIFDFLKEALLTILGQKITRKIRMDMMRKMERVGAEFFSANDSGAVVSRFTNDVETINGMFTSGVVSMIIDSFKIVGIIATMWWFSSKLGLIALLMLPVIYGITRLFQRRMLQAQTDNRIQVGQVNHHIAESMKNLLMIKSFSKEAYMEQNYIKLLLDNYRTLDKVNFYDAIFSPIIQILRSLTIGVIVVLSSGQLNFLGISLGMVAASIELISNLFSPIENLGMELQNIQKAISGIRRVNEFNNEPEDERKDDDLKAEQIIPDRSAVQMNFRHVSFQYETGTDILQDIDLSLHPREKVTFVGRTGVGKSTLFKLAMGLLRPQEGKITINGIDVCAIPNREKRKIFGYVDHSFHLIKGTVADQISLQDDSISRRQIENALEFTGMNEYVDSLGNGLDTVVDGDNLFSQGQKQLLAIARAIVTDPPILLLDEITANLDSVTEANIVAVLQKASQAHTILSISHRLSSMIASDRIVILEKGRVRNIGSPDELMQSDEWYRSHITLEKMTWG